MATQSTDKVNGDVFIDVPRAEYGFVTGTIKNATGAAVNLSQEDMIGYPVKLVSGQYELAIPGTDEGTVDGLVFNPQAGVVQNNNTTTTAKFVFLIRGPAIVNLNKIKSGFTLATLQATLAALSPPVIRFTNASVTEDATA